MPHKFHYYKGGIFGLQGECREDLHGGHAITLIGYGTDNSGNDYWIIKNSWGTDWGKNGFAKISRSRDCLPKYGMVPIVWKYEQIMGLFLDWNKVNTYIKHSFYFRKVFNALCSVGDHNLYVFLIDSNKLMQIQHTDNIQWGVRCKV